MAILTMPLDRDTGVVSWQKSVIERKSTMDSYHQTHLEDQTDEVKARKAAELVPRIAARQADPGQIAAVLYVLDVAKGDAEATSSRVRAGSCRARPPLMKFRGASARLLGSA